MEVNLSKGKIFEVKILTLGSRAVCGQVLGSLAMCVHCAGGVLATLGSRAMIVRVLYD
jgi:hypothetical protein